MVNVAERVRIQEEITDRVEKERRPEITDSLRKAQESNRVVSVKQAEMFCQLLRLDEKRRRGEIL